MNSTTHEKDFYAWTQEQSQLLKTGQLHQIDWQNIAEEIEDMGRSEKRQLESRLELLIMHLLKWQFQPNLRSRSWQLTIKEQRLRLRPALPVFLTIEALTCPADLAMHSRQQFSGKDLPHPPYFLSI